MRITLARAGSIAFAGTLLLLAGAAAAQPAISGCTSTPTAQGTQTLRCEAAITIVAESGAKFELGDRNRDGHVDSVELSSKALLLEVPKKPGRARFNVTTPQAIAAVRGTKWAVDAESGKTSVFVVEGRVSVANTPEDRWPEVRASLDQLRPLSSQALMGIYQMTMADEVDAAFGKQLERLSRSKR